ncbi:TIGR01777 family oxidoreductase [Gaoshiqia sp. Z1-71]|uniref:TIGR01777 family oxidoreductase n=1 Tax=Gaoshiqia hydrogeniformans TaxID=3290090 RepID=UPI003BF8AFE1
MKIAITGSHGYIGQKLVTQLEKQGHEMKPLTRLLIYGNAEAFAAELAGCEGLINLSGAPILKRWTKLNKSVIYNSRVVTTAKLTQAVNLLPGGKKPKVFVSMSATGIYSPSGSHDENSSDFDAGFIGELVKDWESATDTLDGGVRRVIFRTGVVLGKNSQTIQNLLPVFKAGFGGKIGHGKQAFPFIHIDDLITAFSQSIADSAFTGVYNLTAPEQATNETLTNLLAERLRKPVFFRVPAFLLKLAYGSAAQLMLESPFVVPDRLLRQGFTFRYPTLAESLQEIVGEG